ncbi:MAG: tetratricopeptide (TPR) repeat protein [Myxococcota bacterium]|jgi:tetratricopeptide (TPR) repeat protein
MDIEALRNAVVADPTDHKAFEELHNACIDNKDFSTLKEVYEEVFPAIEGTDEQARILRIVDKQARTNPDAGIKHWLNAQLGLLFWKKLDNPDRAEVYFRRVQDAAGQKGGLVGEFYTVFYALRDNWRRLEQLFSSQGFSEIETKRKLAELAEEKGKNDKALVFWQAVYNADQSDEAVYDRLKELYGEVGKWHSLVELLKKRLKTTDDDVDAAVAIHLEMIEIYNEHIKSDTKIIAEWQQVLKLQPGNLAALDAMEAAYTTMKRWPDLVRVLGERVDVVDDVEEKVALHRRMAGIMLDRFSNSSEAIMHYEAILELQPENLDAIGSLKGLYEQRKAWEQYVELAQREIGLTTDTTEDRTEQLIALAALASERIRHPRIATGLWEEIRDHNPTNAQALSELESLYERDKSFEKLVGVLEARAEQTEGDEKAAILEKLAQTYGSRLKDDDSATTVWKRVLELNGEHRKAFNDVRKRSLATKDWETLDWLYTNYGSVSDLTRTFESQLKNLDDDEKLPLLQQIASLWTSEGQTAKAVRALEQVLELDPSNARAAASLLPIYEELGEWEKLTEAYDVVLENTTDPEERRELLTAKAAIHEEHLGDIDAAFFCYVEAYKEDSKNTEVRAQFDRLAETSGEWGVYVSVLEQVIGEIEGDDAALTETTLRAAHVQHEKLGNHDAALAHYQRVNETLDPGNQTALDAIERIFRETERWEELIDVLHSKLHGSDLAADDEKALRFEIGAVWRDRLEEPDAAMGVYREMMERFPDDTRIYDELAHLHLQAEEWVELSDVLQRKLRALADAAGSSPADLADLQCKLGMLEYGRSGDVARAVQYYADALAADPHCDLAVKSLTELLADEGQRQSIAAALEPIYVERDAHSELADILEIRLAGAEDDSRGREILGRLIDLYENDLSDGERALWAGSRLFELAPGQPGLRERLESLADAQGEWQHLTDLYEMVVSDVDNESIRLEIHQTIAVASSTHLEDADRAERNYLDILEISPNHETTIDALEALYGATDQPAKLLDILRKKEQLATDDETRIGFRFQTAALLADRLERVEEAIDDMREVLGMSPGHADALARLDSLYMRTEQWMELHDVLLTRIENAADDDERAMLLMRLGELREEQLDSTPEAIETYAEVLMIDVAHADAIDALERLFDDPEHAGFIAPVLEQAYLAQDSWEGLVRVYLVMEETSDDPEAKVQKHYQIAKLYEEKGNEPEQAFMHYGEAYMLAPASEETMAQLQRLADGLDAHEPLANLLVAQVDEIADSGRRREVHRIIAALLADKCDNAPKAIEQYRAVLDIEPDDRGAIDALVALYRKSAAWENLVELIRRKATLAGEPEERQALLLEAGEIAANELEAETAIAVYEEVLMTDPSSVEALDAVGGLYESTDQWGELTRILRRKIELSEDLDERKAIARELAGVQEAFIEDLDAAIETRRLVLSWDATDLVELNALDELMVKTERWLDLIGVIDQQIGLVDENAAKHLALRKASIWKDKQNDTIESIGVLRSILDSDPDETRAQDALETIVRNDDDRENAFEVLAPVLEISDQWGRTYELWDTLVEHRDDPFSRITGLHRMGEIAETRLNDPERAFACYGRALQADLHNATSMEAVERLAAEHGLWEQLTQLLLDGAANADDPTRGQQLRLRAAEILKEQISDFDRAIATYRAVLEEDDQNFQALTALDELYQVTEKWDDLALTLGTLVEITNDQEEKVKLLFRLANTAETHLGDTDTAFECYREVFYAQPDNAEATEELERLAQGGAHRQDIASLLEPIYIERKQWTKLHSLLELRLEVEEDEVDRLDLMRRLANLNLNELERKPEAIQWLGEAFRLDPGDDGLLVQLEQLSEETDEYGNLKEVLLAVAIGHDDDERKVVLWHKAAVILEGQLHDTDQAEMIYKLMLQTDEEHVPALTALDRIYLAQSRWDDLEMVLDREIDAVEFDDDRVLLLMRMGELIRDRQDRPDDAIDAFNGVLELQETHQQALSAVSDLYRAAEDWEPLFDVVRRRVEVAESDDERVDHLRDLADMAENRLDKAPEAISLWEDVLNIRYEDVAAMRNLQRLHRAGGSDSDLVDAMERELRVLDTAEPERRAGLYREMGRLYDGDLDDSLRAQEAWQQLLTVEENDVEAMQALAQLHEEGGNNDALAAVLQQMVASLRFEGDELKGLYEQLARIHTDALPDATKAIWAWEKVRELAPESLEPVEALEQLFTDEARWEEQVAILDVKAGLVSEADAIEVWLTQGETHQFQLNAWEDAAGAYRKVLDVQADHDDAGQRLEAIYMDNQQWSSLAELLDIRSSFVEDGDDKRDLMVRLAEIYEMRLEDNGVALVYLQAGHREALGDIDVIASIERVAGATDSWQELYDEYTLAIGATDDEVDQTDYHLRAARLKQDKLEDPTGAIDHYRKVLAIDARHADALAQVSDLLQQTEQWEPLVEVLEIRLDDAANASEQTELGLLVADTLREKIGDPERAIVAYRRVLDEGEGDEKAITALEALFRETDQKEELIEILDAKANSGIGNETDIRVEIGALKEGLGDVAGAISVYEDILTYNETHRQALDRLLELYGSTDDWENLTSVYERLLHTADSDADQIQYCEALALLQQQVHQNPEAAADYHYRVLSIDSGHAGSLEALEGLYEGLEQWEDLIDIYRRRLEQAGGDDATWADYKEKSALVYADKLEQHDNAIFAYQELIARVPGHGRSLDALEALFRQTDRPEQVQDILDKKANAAETSEERVDLLCQRAAIVLDDLSDPDGAIDILNRALAEDEGNDRALDLLEKVYTVRRQWDNVIDVLRKRDVFAQTDAEKTAAQVRIAAVYHDHLGDRPKAIEHYERAMEHVPDDVTTSDRLARLYIEGEEWVKAEALLSMVVNRAPDDVEDSWRAQLHYNLGLALENLMRPEDALREYETAHSLAPEDLSSMKALGKMAYAQGNYSQAEEIYSQIVEHVEGEADEDELIELYKTLGQIAFKAGSAEKAREYLERTVTLQPGSPDALQSLITLCEQQGYHQGVVDYAAELQGLLTDPLEQFELQLRIGDTYLKHLSDPEEAVVAYKSALDFQPDSKAAHFKIFQVLMGAERFEEAVEILSRLVELEHEPKKKAQYLGAIGDIYRKHLDNNPLAVDYYNQALDHDASLLKLFRAIDEVLTRDKDWKNLQRAYRSMLTRVQHDDAQIQLQHKLCFNLGEIYRTRLKDPQSSKAAFEAALDIKPNDVKSLQILSELYGRDKDIEQALDTSRRLLKLEPGNVEHYRRLKSLYFEAGDEDAAWVACSILSLQGLATETEQKFYEEHATTDMAVDADTPEGDVWARGLLSKGEDLLIGNILATVFEGMVGSISVKTLKELGLKKKNLVDTSKREMFPHVFNECVRVLGMNPAPAVYHSTTANGIVLGETIPKVMLIGNSVIQGQTEQELAFATAKALTYFHPLHFAVGLAPQGTLEWFFHAAIKLFVAKYDVGALDKNPNFQEILAAMAEMPAHLTQRLQKHVADFVGRGKKPNLTRWLNQIELSANHAGLVMCNDVVKAGQIIKAESHRALFTAPGRLGTLDKLVDLAVYAMSEEYLALRKELQVTIDH